MHKNVGLQTTLLVKKDTGLYTEGMRVGASRTNYRVPVVLGLCVRRSDYLPAFFRS